MTSHRTLDTKFHGVGRTARTLVAKGGIGKPDARRAARARVGLSRFRPGHNDRKLEADLRTYERKAKLAAKFALDKAAFGRTYRGYYPAQDELVSTSSVREFLNGFLQGSSKAPIPAGGQKAVDDVLLLISGVRMDTRWMGFNRKGPPPTGGFSAMQHPTSPGSGFWVAKAAGGGSAHSALDLKRRVRVAAAMETASKAKGATLHSIAFAGLRASVVFTLNEFMAPGLASDQSPVSKVSRTELRAQTLARERLKVWSVTELGATLATKPKVPLLKLSALTAQDRPWGDRTDEAQLSPRRAFPELP